MNTIKASMAIGGLVLLICFGHAQPVLASTNQVAQFEPLYIPPRTNEVPVSKAIQVASRLWAGMKESDAADFLKRNGINSYLVGTNGTTNVYSLSIVSGGSRTTSYPLAKECSLALDIRITQMTSNGWGQDGILERAFIARGGSNLISIALTNAP